MAGSLSIREIYQKDNTTFSIHWDDDLVQDFRLSDLQKKCPCAHCQKSDGTKNISDQLKAVAIRSVGHYGLRIQFTSGCSSGIYTFESLRQIKG